MFQTFVILFYFRYEHGEDLLSDYEVYKVFIESDEDGCRKRKDDHSSADSIRDDVREYLSNKCCANQNPDNILKIMKCLNEFPIQLTRYEKLMIINTPPRSHLHLSLLVKDCEERFDEEQMNTLLTLIDICLPITQELDK